MKEIVNLDFAIVGGGIIGLSLAKGISGKFPNSEIALFEKETYIGEHTSGRNSGVLHAGIYYQNNSLKHLLCIRGNELWDDWATQLGVEYRRTGKWIVAKDQQENQELESILGRALKNQVPGIRSASQSECKNLDQIVHCSTALFSPRTGIINQSQALVQLRAYLESRNALFLTNSEVLTVEKLGDGYTLELENYTVKTKVLINCAGLSAISLRQQLGLEDLVNYWVKGCYLKTSQTPITNELIYPVPLKNLKGLGVHLTLDFDGSMKFGPNTIDVDKIDYGVDDSILPEMLGSIKKFFRTIDIDRLKPDYAGIRPKLKNQEGQLVPDFVIQNPLNNYWEFLGIESPGFTAAPAISEFFTKKI